MCSHGADCVGQGMICALDYDQRTQDAISAMERSITLKAALMEIVRIIDHEQPLGNGHKIRETAAAALQGAMSK